MTVPRLPDLLEHIRQAAFRALEYVQGLDQSVFLADRRTQDAVIRCLTVIGEAVTRMMTHHAAFIESHQNIPWRAMRTMRNRLMHGYDEINLDTVWDVTQTDLPALLEQMPPPEP